MASILAGQNLPSTQLPGSFMDQKDPSVPGQFQDSKINSTIFDNLLQPYSYPEWRRPYPASAFSSRTGNFENESLSSRRGANDDHFVLGSGAELEDSGSPSSTKALSTNLFGFETVLTSLVYVSFGIFLLQMAQKTINTRMTTKDLQVGGTTLSGLLSTLFDASSGRDIAERGGFRSNVSSHLDTSATLLPVLDALEKAPDFIAGLGLAWTKGFSIYHQRPSCLPLFLCRLQSRLSQHPDAGTSMMSAIVSASLALWAGIESPSALLESAAAAYEGQQGASCEDFQPVCVDPAASDDVTSTRDEDDSNDADGEQSTKFSNHLWSRYPAYVSNPHLRAGDEHLRDVSVTHYDAFVRDGQ